MLLILYVQAINASVFIYTKNYNIIREIVLEDIETCKNTKDDLKIKY